MNEPVPVTSSIVTASMRELYAAQVIQALILKYGLGGEYPGKRLAKMAFGVADDMIAEAAKGAS